jgi:predicted nucleic-acid-binding Zn-ribbon protein
MEIEIDKMQCPKCHGQMVQGFVPDFSVGAVLVGSWHTGQPQKSVWQVIKARHAEGIPIGAFRCQKCGFLEFYADASFAAK